MKSLTTLFIILLILAIVGSFTEITLIFLQSEYILQVMNATLIIFSLDLIILLVLLCKGWLN